MSKVQGSENEFTEFGDLSSAAIIAGLRGDFWKQVICYGSVGSTNELALSLPAAYSEAGTAVIADSQTKGKGRLGRVWVSPPGINIYMSALLAPKIPPRQAFLLTVAATLASASAIRDITGLDLKVKWPNDLIVGNKKIGGILTELRSAAHRIRCAVIGIGINVNSGKGNFPAELSSSATSMMVETGNSYSRNEVISEILNELERWYEELLVAGGASLLAAWRSLSETIGRDVRVARYADVLSGVAEGIDENGMLILRLPSGDRKRISSGDVTELR